MEKTKKMRKNSIVCILLIGLLLSTFVLIKPAVAEEPEYQNISVQQAYNMIKHTPGVIILDVRNQNEYDLGHLYDAQLIPLNSLANKTMPIDLPLPLANDTVMLDVYQRIMSSFNLSAHVNDPIIVYCKGGSRSAPACEILVEHGFTQVYNMIGGITAWMQADYEIYTSNHYVTVEFDDDEPLIDIKPLLLYAANQTCSNQSTPTVHTPGNFTAIEVLQNSTDTLCYILTYEVNGTEATMMVNKTQLWQYEDSLDGCNRTALLMSTEMTIWTEGIAQNITSQSFDLTYHARSSNYNVALRTTLQNPTNESYGTAYTVFGYAPTNKTGVLSVENVQFNSSITLSDHYSTLGKVSKQLGHLYEKSNAEDLTQLSIGYGVMEAEAKNFGRKVQDNLAIFDKPILNSSATLVDTECTEICGYTCGIIGTIACSSVCAGIALGCTVYYPVCLVVCLAGCGALSGALCTWLCGELCGDPATVNEIGCGLFCGGLCGNCPDEAGYLCWVCDSFCNTVCNDLFPANPDPEPEPFANYWGSSVYSTDTWGYGCVDSEDNIVGSMPDGNYAELSAYEYDSMARITVTMSSQATGEVIVNGYSNVGYTSRMIVYVSSDAYNWNLIYDDYVYDTSPTSIYCGYASNFNYVMINVYSDGYYYDCDLFVDNVWVVYQEPPANEYYWGQSISWTETYGAGSAVNNPSNMLIDPNGNYGQLYAPNYGCMARASVVTNELAVGNIGVYGYSVSGYYSLFYVYVSSDNSNWNFVSSQVVSSSSPNWINFGIYAGPFRYILLIGYDYGNSVNLQIDAVRVTP